MRESAFSATTCRMIAETVGSHSGDSVSGDGVASPSRTRFSTVIGNWTAKTSASSAFLAISSQLKVSMGAVESASRIVSVSVFGIGIVQSSLPRGSTPIVIPVFLMNLQGVAAS